MNLFRELKKKNTSVIKTQLTTLCIRITSYETGYYSISQLHVTLSEKFRLIQINDRNTQKKSKQKNMKTSNHSSEFRLVCDYKRESNHLKKKIR